MLHQSTIIAGVDEAGRGPLAGPVIAAAVVLDPNQPIAGLTDSKKLTQRKREQLFDEIIASAAAYAIARAEVAEIDEINILQASLLAMKRAVLALPQLPDQTLVDGIHRPDVPGLVKAVVKGDLTIPSISAASILAKVARDREMLTFDHIYPGYGFASHKGYPTKQHVNAIKALGVSPIHRKSFAPVKHALQARQHESIYVD